MSICVSIYKKNNISALYNIIIFINTNLAKNGLYCEKFWLLNSTSPLGPSLNVGKFDNICKIIKILIRSTHWKLFWRNPEGSKVSTCPGYLISQLEKKIFCGYLILWLSDCKTFHSLAKVSLNINFSIAVQWKCHQICYRNIFRRYKSPTCDTRVSVSYIDQIFGGRESQALQVFYFAAI